MNYCLSSKYVFFKFEDPCELPICEASLACDNLLCDANGRPPNAVLVVHVYIPSDRVWVRYARTEVVEVRISINDAETFSGRN